MKYIKKFETLQLQDTPTVGGKNSSLGQMIADLSSQGVQVPTGFAVTAQAYWYYINHNNLLDDMKKIMSELKDYKQAALLSSVGKKIRALIVQGDMPDDLVEEIKKAYDQLCKHYDQEECDVAVRSSATAEDLPTASFAGQQETYLNIRGYESLIESCKKAMASLFTDRAIAYRIEQGFDHFK
ncbi:phosphoenolpyruvate synthase, partial [bacterium]|nr:phosphoenolpyruvate synthase [bacterium]